jgi:hypothetical protein
MHPQPPCLTESLECLAVERVHNTDCNVATTMSSLNYRLLRVSVSSRKRLHPHPKRLRQRLDRLELRLDPLLLDGLHGGWTQAGDLRNGTNRCEIAAGFVVLVSSASLRLRASHFLAARRPMRRETVARA